MASKIAIFMRFLFILYLSKYIKGVTIMFLRIELDSGPYLDIVIILLRRCSEIISRGPMIFKVLLRLFMVFYIFSFEHFRMRRIQRWHQELLQTDLTKPPKTKRESLKQSNWPCYAIESKKQISWFEQLIRTDHLGEIKLEI